MSFGGIEDDGDVCGVMAHGRMITAQTPSHCRSLSPSPQPTPNTHRPIDHSPEEVSNRPTRCQIAPLEIVPVFRSRCHTPRTALASPPFPSRPGTPILIGRRLRGLQMANNRRRTRKKRTNPSRRMSSLCNVPHRLLTDLM